MWLIRWNKYRYSKLATFVSVIGALTRYGGVFALVNGLILGGIITFAIGVGIHFLAESIAKGKEPKKETPPKTAATSGAASASAAAQKTANTAQTAQRPAQTAQPTQPAQPAAPVKTRCPNCGAEAPAQSAFCNQCGSRLAPKTSRAKKCLRCGRILEDGSTYCTHCGYQNRAD